MDPRNPYTAEHTVTLSDGVARRLRFDTNALILVEEATGLTTAQVLTRAGSVRVLRAAVYAGLVRAGIAEWSLEKAAQMLDGLPLPDVQAAVQVALLEAVAGPEKERARPETPASASAATGRPRPGRGKKR